MLRNAELEMPAVRVHGPALRADHLLLPKDIDPRFAREYALGVDPAAQVGRNRHVGRSGDDAFRQRAFGAGDVGQNAAETLLGRHAFARRRVQLRRDGDFRRVETTMSAAVGQERGIGDKGLEHGGPVLHAGESLPLPAFVNAHSAPEFRHLRRIHDAGVVVLVPGERQVVALDGVGDEAGRAIVGHAPHAVQDGAHVLAGQVGHQRVQTGVVVTLQQRPNARHVADIAHDLAAPGLTAFVNQGRIERVRAVVDPLTQRLAPRLRKCRL